MLQSNMDDGVSKDRRVSESNSTTFIDQSLIDKSIKKSSLSFFSAFFGFSSYVGILLIFCFYIYHIIIISMLSCAFAIMAVVLGVMALKNKYTNKRMARVGIIAGGIWLLIFITMHVLIIMLRLY